MSKLLWIDAETGGLHPGTHALLEVGFIVDIDGAVMEEQLFQIKPFPEDSLDTQAMMVNGISKMDIMGFVEPRDAFRQMHEIFDKYIDKYDTADKFLPAGYNVPFDLMFLETFFTRNDFKYTYSYISHNTIDLLAVVRYLVGKGMLALDNCKLATACKHFGIEAGVHSALADARATRKLSMALDEWLKAGLVRDYITSMPEVWSAKEHERH